jgi:hypothetical protein
MEVIAARRLSMSYKLKAHIIRAIEELKSRNLITLAEIYKCNLSLLMNPDTPISEEQLINGLFLLIESMRAALHNTGRLDGTLSNILDISRSHLDSIQ